MKTKDLLLDKYREYVSIAGNEYDRLQLEEIDKLEQQLKSEHPKLAASKNEANFIMPITCINCEHDSMSKGCKIGNKPNENGSCDKWQYHELTWTTTTNTEPVKEKTAEEKEQEIFDDLHHWSDGLSDGTATNINSETSPSLARKMSCKFWNDVNERFYNAKIAHDYKDGKFDYRTIAKWFLCQPDLPLDEYASHQVNQTLDKIVGEIEKKIAVYNQSTGLEGCNIYRAQGMEWAIEIINKHRKS
jgi:hypothetical protein